jgi:N utilization substance protein A
VNQVRITDIENRQMEVIVNEDQLSLAIGKRGQNVRLATKLVGWNIDIRSEEELKKEVAEQMGAMIASGAPVPLAAIQVVSAQQAETLGEHGVTDIDGLVNTSVDDLVEFLDVSLDEAEKVLAAARSVIEIRERSLQAPDEGDDASAAEVEASRDDAAETAEVESTEDPTAAGYDEAVENGVPFSAEEKIRAEFSADPVALTEADPMSVDELILQDAGRDLRPDVITPAPDITSLDTADLSAASEEDFAEVTEGDDRIAAAPATETDSALASSSDETAATDESLKDEKQ